MICIDIGVGAHYVISASTPRRIGLTETMKRSLAPALHQYRSSMRRARHPSDKTGQDRTRQSEASKRQEQAREIYSYRTRSAVITDVWESRVGLSEWLVGANVERCRLVARGTRIDLFNGRLILYKNRLRNRAERKEVGSLRNLCGNEKEWENSLSSSISFPADFRDSRETPNTGSHFPRGIWRWIIHPT